MLLSTDKLYLFCIINSQFLGLVPDAGIPVISTKEKRFRSFINSGRELNFTKSFINSITSTMVQLNLTVTLLSSLVIVTNAVKKQTFTYKYKTGSNQAYTASYWIGTNCLSSNYFDVFAADGFTEEGDANQVAFKSVSGNGQFYTNCNENGATSTSIAFAETDNPKLVAFKDSKAGKNATISSIMEAYLYTQECGVESYTEEFGGENFTYFYYACDDAFTESYANITVDTFMKINPGTDLYTTKYTETTTSRGTVTKVDSKSACQDAVVTRKVIKIGKTRLNIPSFSTTGQICKASSGFVSTTKFV